MIKVNEGTAQTPIEDLIKDALDDYENASKVACNWNSLIPQAIMAYKKPKWRFRLFGFMVEIKAVRP